MTPAEHAKDWFSISPRHRTADRLTAIIQRAVDDALGRFCKRCNGTGYLVGDAEFQPYAVVCPDCRTATSSSQ